MPNGVIWVFPVAQGLVSAGYLYPRGKEDAHPPVSHAGRSSLTAAPLALGLIAPTLVPTEGRLIV